MKITPFKLERYFSKHEFSAKYLLCSSDIESLTIEALLEMENGAKNKLMKLSLGYTESQGSPWLREEISKLYTKCNKENILVHAGAQEAIFLSILALASKGDHVIVQTPCYQSLLSVPEGIGCRITKWEMRYENGKWDIDIEKLNSLITSDTKFLLINTPHNPTSFQFNKEQIEEIKHIVSKNNIIVFSDEVYHDLQHSSGDIVPAFCDIYENTLSLNVMSKSYGLAGLRIGWLASQRKDLLEKIWMYKEYTTICNSAPSEFLAALALKQSEKILSRNRSIINSNLKLLDDFFSKYDSLFEWSKPNAGVTAFIKLKQDINEESFANKLLESKSVLLLPGSVYDHPGFFRLGFGRLNMPIALKLFEEYIDENY
jgi:aspartate/methionine/tyrosine aminotransferase